MRLVAAALAFLALALQGCGKSRQQIEAEFAAKEAASKAKAEPEAQAKEQAEFAAVKSRLLGALTRRLKDPDSVKYQGIDVKLSALSDKNGRRADAVCGQFNAKNSMGGYSGFSTFYVYQFDQDEPRIWTTEQSEPYASIARDGARSMGCS